MSKITAVIKPVGEELGKFAKAATDQVAGQSQDETREFVKSLYAPSEKNKTNVQNNPQKPQGETEEQKIEKLRQELHSKYYQRTFNPPKQQEERPAEKVEKEKMQDLQQKEKKKPPVLVQRARERVEKYPGASG